MLFCILQQVTKSLAAHSAVQILTLCFGIWPLDASHNSTTCRGVYQLSQTPDLNTDNFNIECLSPSYHRPALDCILSLESHFETSFQSIFYQSPELGSFPALSHAIEPIIWSCFTKQTACSRTLERMSLPYPAFLRPLPMTLSFMVSILYPLKILNFTTM